MKLLIKNENKKRKTVLIKNVTSRLSLMSLCTRQPFLKQIITRMDRQTDRQTKEQKVRWTDKPKDLKYRSNTTHRLRRKKSDN